MEIPVEQGSAPPHASYLPELYLELVHRAECELQGTVQRALVHFCVRKKRTYLHIFTQRSG